MPNTLQQWLLTPRDDLVKAVQEDVLFHVNQLRTQGHHFCCYALGFDPEATAPFPWVMTNMRRDIAEHEGSSDYDYFMYFPNEWKHWWNEPPFARTNRVISVYETTYLNLAPPQSEELVIPEHALAHFHATLRASIKALFNLRSQGTFTDDIFLLVWVGASHWDEDWPIERDSVQQLNAIEHVTRYCRILDGEDD
ncbi:MAG: DUF4303 domain-containing protein [Bradymonadia bacterium]